MANKWGREEEEEEFGEEEKKVPGFVSHPTRRNYARTFQEARRPKHWSLERSSPPQTHARFETSQQSLFNWHEDRHVYTTNWSVPSQATPPISFPFISFPVLIFGYPSDPPLSLPSLSYAIYIDNFTLDVASISTRSSYSSRVEGFVWIPERSGGEKGGKRLSTGEDKIGNQWNYGPQREEDKIGQQTNQSVDSDPNWRNEREERERKRWKAEMAADTPRPSPRRAATLAINSKTPSHIFMDAIKREWGKRKFSFSKKERGLPYYYYCVCYTQQQPLRRV